MNDYVLVSIFAHVEEDGIEKAEEELKTRLLKDPDQFYTGNSTYDPRTKQLNVDYYKGDPHTDEAW